MAETNNFNKICNIAMDSNSDILEELTDGQIDRIKFDPKHVYVVYATDEMFSGWGMKAKAHPMICEGGLFLYHLHLFTNNI